MTPDYAAKRIEHLRLAREAKAAGDPALESLHHIVSQNYDTLASGDQASIARLTIPQPPLTESIFDKNLRRLNEALAARDVQSK